MTDFRIHGHKCIHMCSYSSYKAAQFNNLRRLYSLSHSVVFQGYTRLMRLISLYMKSPEYCDLICEGKWVNFRRDVFSLVERISLTFAPDVVSM